jgi:predicted SAM-dependent methyltransferase
MKLNLGSGKMLLEGYENVDIRGLPGTVKADIRNLPYAENSAEEILAIDVLEHASHLETTYIIGHWISILKPGGVLKIQAPCLPNICGYIMSGIDPEKIAMGIRLLFGDQDYPENTHRTIIHPILLKHILVMELCIPEDNIAFNMDCGMNIKVIIKKPENKK